MPNEKTPAPVIKGVYRKVTASQDARIVEFGDKKFLSFNAYHTNFVKEGDKFVPKDTEFFSVTLRGKSIEYLAPRIKKGMQLAVFGATKENTFTTKDGEQRRETLFYADDVSLTLNQSGIKAIDFRAPEKKTEPER